MEKKKKTVFHTSVYRQFQHKMLGLSGLFFGVWGIIPGAWFGLLLPAAVSLLERIQQHTVAQGGVRK